MARAVELKVEDFGWTKDTTSKCLELPPLEPTMPIAPNLLLKITFCGCCSAQPCSSNRYSCKEYSMTCNILCKCPGTCYNSDPAAMVISKDDLALIDDYAEMKTTMQ